MAAALLLPRSMPLRKNIPSFKEKVYSVLMLLALAWLTVSLPFVYAQQQAQKEITQKQCKATSADDDSNPLTNTTEEKTSTSNTLSEYLHTVHITEHPSLLVVKSYNSHASDLYLAFHPELICPPPDVHAS